MMPKRIQLRRTKGWRMPANTVKVDRSTKWGNPFKVGSTSVVVVHEVVGAAIHEEHIELTIPMTVDMSRQAFRHWLRTTPYGRKLVRQARRELRGKDLACWCGPKCEWCHADVWLELANETASAGKERE